MTPSCRHILSFWVGLGIMLLVSSVQAQTAQPDLFVGSIAVNPTVGPPGGNVDLTFEIRNGGQGDAGPFNVSIYFSTTSTLDLNKAVLLHSLVINNLSKGSSTIQRATVTIPKQASVNQTAYLAVMADSGMSVTESNENNNVTTSTFNVKPGPDLTVDTMILSRSVVSPGEQITVTYTLKNIGRADVLPFESSIYYSNDALIDTNDTLLDRASVQYLPVANSITLIRTITIPSHAQINQNYFLAVFVDPTGQRSEEDETNNIKMLQIQVVPPSPQKYADFVVDSITLIDKSQRLGKTVYYTAEFKNQGQGTGDFYAYLDYSNTSDFRSYKSWYIVSRYTLNAGQTYTYNSTFQVPWESPYDQAPQDYYLRIRITSASNEQITSNNTSQTVIFKALEGQSNLHFAGLSFSPNTCNYHLDTNNVVTNPKNATGTLTIQNSGYITSEPIEVGLYLSDDNVISSQDILVVKFAIPAIDAQKSVTKNISFTFNATIPAGLYRFAVILDPDNKQTKDEKSQTRADWLFRSAQFLFSQTLPDLKIDKLVYSPSAKADIGTRIDYEVWVRNLSSQAVNTGCTHTTYSNVFFADDVNLTQVIFTSYNNSFPTSNVTRLTGYIDVPSTIAPRKGYLVFQIDTSNVHELANPSNKRVVIPYEITPQSIDLNIVSATTTPTTIAWEEKVTVDVMLTNLGTLQSVKNTRTCVWFSYDQTYQQQQDEDLGSVYIDFTRTPSLTGSMTFTAKRWNEGKAYLLLKVNCDKAYPESDENNNDFVIPITIRKFKVDFVVTSLTAAPNQIRPGLSTQVRVEVQNKGPDQHIQRVGVCIYLSNDQQWDTKDSLMGCGTTTDIYNHFGVATFTITGTSSFLAGTQYVIARIDSGYSCASGTQPNCPIPNYDETDENNNEATIPIFVRNDVDLTVASLSVSQTIAKIGDNLTFRFQVKNIGTVGSNTPFDVMVVFSDNEVINKQDRLIKTIRIPALAPNTTSTDFTVSYAIPSDVQPGERYFGLIIDEKDEVTEVDETNNLGSVKVNVLVPGIDLQIAQARLDRSVIPAGKASDVVIYSDIQNFGSSDSAAFDVGFYLSTDTTFDPGDTLLATRKYTQTLPSLARTGQFVDKVQITLKQSNTFYVLVVADPLNQIQETIKSNNTQALAIQIVNRAPTITSSPSVRAIEKQLYTYLAQALDPDGDAVTWRLSRGPVGMTIDAQSGQINWTPQSFDGGKDVDVSIEASDGRGGVTQQDFKISVQGVNDPPQIISTAPQRALAGQSFTYTPRATDPDANDTLTWVLLNGPTGMQIDPTSGQLTWAVPTGLAGQKVTVEIQVSDSNGASDKQTFTLTISKQNGKPSIVSKAPSVAYAGTVFRYQALASDPDPGDTLTWSRTSGPTSLTIDSVSGLVSWTVPVGLTGQNVDITIRVSDQVGDYTEQTFTLTISRNNTAPKIVSTPPQSSYVGRLWNYTPTATDPDVGDQLAWSLLKGPAGITIDPSTGKLEWTPPQSAKDSSVEISIQVSDVGSLTDTQTFSLWVGQYCDVDSDCSSPQICLLHLCRPPGCFDGGCKDAAKLVCTDDGTCQADPCANISCTGGEFCYQGACVSVCAYVSCNSGEVCANGACVVDACDQITCQSGQRCSAGQCVPDPCASGTCAFQRKCVQGTCRPDPCVRVKCPGNKMVCDISRLQGTPQCVLPTPCRVDSQCSGDLICEAGICSPPVCYHPNQPCSSGEVCLRGRCQANPCAGKTCGAGQFCRDGRCIDVCAGVSCPAGQTCLDGRCQSDSCSAATCNSGETCIKGLCEKNLCVTSQSCKYNRICVDNTCLQDPCLFMQCPVSTQRCVNGQCQDPPACQLDDECPNTQLCVKGRCIPSQCDPTKPCNSGTLCEDGRCRNNPCQQQTCAGNTFCREGLCVGSCSGVFCSTTERCQFGFCRVETCATVRCNSDEICVRGQCRKNICTKTQTPCKQGRVCTVDGCIDSPCTQASCPQGQTCDPQTGQCSGDLTCTYDVDCPGQAICEQGKCVAARCYAETCSQGQLCWQGNCQSPPCDGKNCPSGEYCHSKGQCAQVCNCPKGQRCGDNGCEVDPCAATTCPPAQVCENGTCRDRCKQNACKFSRLCVAGVGCQQDPCTAVTCPPSSVCRRGFCVEPCSELRCPDGTVCTQGQCIATPPEPIQAEPTEEPVVSEKTNITQEPGPEPPAVTDATASEPNTEPPPLPTGCNCQSVPTVPWFAWLGILLLLLGVYKHPRKYTNPS